MSRFLAWGLLVAASAALLLPGLGAIDLWEPDEPRIAQVAEELRSGAQGPKGLVLLHLNGEPYTQKPPLYYWMAAALGAPGGRVSEVAARLPSALAGVATVALTAAFGMRFLGAATGLLGGALLLSTWQFAYLARRAQLDVVLALFETLALVAFWRLDRGLGGRAANAALLHAALGLAVLTKGPVGFLVPLAAAAGWLAWERRLRDLRRAVPAWALLLSLGPGLAWLAAASAAAPSGFFGEAVGENVFGRFFSGTSHERPFYYYVYQYPVDCLPWTLLWPALWWVARRDVFGAGGDPAHRSRWRFLLAWVAASLVFFSFSAGKRGLYLVPTLPAMALLCADALRLRIATRGATPPWIGRLAAGLGAALAIGAVALARAGGVGEVPVPAGFAAAVVAAVVVCALAWRMLRDAPLARVGVLAAGAAAVQLAAFSLLFPALDADKSPRAIAEAAAARTSPGEPVGLVGDAHKAPGLVYYGGRRVVALEGPDEIRRFLAAGGRTLVVRRNKLQRVEAVTPVDILAALRGNSERQFLVVSPRAPMGAHPPEARMKMWRQEPAGSATLGAPCRTPSRPRSSGSTIA